MKTFYIALIIAAILMPVVLSAYDDPDTPSIDSKMSSGLAACRSFAANYRYQSPTDDRYDFQNRFGQPRDTNVSPYSADDVTTEYDFDNLTKITLECHGSSCRARCASKY